MQINTRYSGSRSKVSRLSANKLYFNHLKNLKFIWYPIGNTQDLDGASFNKASCLLLSAFSLSTSTDLSLEEKEQKVS